MSVSAYIEQRFGDKMARKSEKEQPKPSFLPPDKLKEGITKLRRRIEELEEFDISTIEERWDPKTKALTTKINATLAEVFGYDTIEFQQYYMDTLDTLPIIVGKENPLGIVQEGYRKGIRSAVVKMESIKEILEEKLEDTGGVIEETVLPNRFWQDIHPKITSVAKGRFESAHYADAVLSAFREVNSSVKNIVRRKTGNELDGASLMRTAFSPKNPIIVLDDLSTKSGKNIQQGYMEIFSGAMIGIRNPKAHENMQIKEIPARHRIYLASLLMTKIDERI